MPRFTCTHKKAVRVNHSFNCHFFKLDKSHVFFCDYTIFRCIEPLTNSGLNFSEGEMITFGVIIYSVDFDTKVPAAKRYKLPTILLPTLALTILLLKADADKE